MCMLYLYSFEYNPPDDGLVEAETCRRHIINKKIIDYVLCNLLDQIFYIQTIARIVALIKFAPVLLCN